ncbi:MAG: hypothetical protein DRP93_07195 [Candidatus Neomarinimicrobiota bacterium]|nr:MAG: hypothetical protein DRP93_07195 [Candidatus Neomarinimicrobiota bacterium]
MKKIESNGSVLYKNTCVVQKAKTRHSGLDPESKQFHHSKILPINQHLRSRDSDISGFWDDRPFTST